MPLRGGDHRDCDGRSAESKNFSASDADGSIPDRQCGARRANRAAMVASQGSRLVRPATLAHRRQLRAGERYQSAQMWQAETFDPDGIDRELGWAQALGMNTMRVFLHDLLWREDSEGFRQRLDRFLQIAAGHGIRPMLVLFDSCWNPRPQLGPQPPPRPGVHNSGWVQSPSAEALANPAEYARLQSYVTGIVAAFATDSRILAWDVWNEPTNVNESIFPGAEAPAKADLVLALLPQVFGWARAAGASQPLTSALWIPEDDWSSQRRMKPNRTDPDQPVGHPLIPQLPGPKGIPAAIALADALSTADDPFGVPGAQLRKHDRGYSTDRQAIQRSRHRVGIGRRQEPDLFPLGLLAEALCRSTFGNWLPDLLHADGTVLQPGRDKCYSRSGWTEVIQGEHWVAWIFRASRTRFSRVG